MDQTLHAPSRDPVANMDPFPHQLKREKKKKKEEENRRKIENRREKEK